MSEPSFGRLLEELKKRAVCDDDKKLVELFEQHREVLTAHFDSCLPEQQVKFASWHPETPAIEIWGLLFHKAFRQWDILPTAQLDIFVWKKLAGGADGSAIFWEAAHAAFSQEDPKTFHG